MPIPKDISRNELLAVLQAYDEYIQDANDNDTFVGGWRPVCLNEFYDNEWAEIISQLDGPNEESKEYRAIEEYSGRAIRNIERLERAMLSCPQS